jgi:hypothetical protein
VAAELQPVVFRPRTNAAGVIWALSGLGVVLTAALFVFTNLGLQFRPSPPIFIGTLVPVVAIALLNRPRPIGLDRAGLHMGSPDKGYVIPWSNVAGVIALPGNLVLPPRIRIGLTDRGFVPSFWVRRRWGVRVLPAAELEVSLGYGQPSADIADEIRHFIDAYG